MLKHWSTKHHSMNTPPEFVFRVVKKHNNALGRLVHEAVKILDCATLNSKSEWIGYKIPRLTVEKTEKDTRDELEKLDKVEKVATDKVNELKDRVLACAEPALNNKCVSLSRKRAKMSANNQNVNQPSAKKQKRGAIVTRN